MKKYLLVLLLPACTSSILQSEIRNEIKLPESLTSSQAVVPQIAPLQVPNRKPIIQQVQVNPTQTVGPDDIITLQALVHDPDNDILQMTWSATKGTISATQGVVISWSPKRSDGQLIKGVASITLLVSDGQGHTDTSSVNISVSADGSAQVSSLPVAPPQQDTVPPTQEAEDTPPAGFPTPPIFTEESP